MVEKTLSDLFLAHLKDICAINLAALHPKIEFAYENGDEATLKAKRDPSSTPC
jgi:hypothetical protein